MKTNFLIIVSILFLLLSCKTNRVKNSRNEKEKDDLCNVIIKMNEDDQKYRKLISPPFFKILDSLKKVNNLSNIQYAKLPRKTQLEYGKLASIIEKKRPALSKVYRDSLMELQIKLDNVNTEILIDIIKKRGYPNKKNCDCKMFPGIIFRHSQSEYWPEIGILIEKEFTEGRMNNGTYSMVKNHINGRKGHINFKRK